MAYAHIPVSQRCGETSFDAVVSKQNQAKDVQLKLLRSELHELNQTIVELDEKGAWQQLEQNQ